MQRAKFYFFLKRILRIGSIVCGDGEIMYLAVFLMILLFTGVSIKKHSLDKYLARITIVILWLMLSFRYGQGTDYFSYNYLYKFNENLSRAVNNYYNLHGEIGFRILCALLKGNFSRFIFIFSTVQMLLLYKGMVENSEKQMLTLLLFYPTLYLTYFFSVIRQGLALALCMGFMFKYFKQKKWIKYVLVCLLASTFHMVSLIWLILPFIWRFKISILYRLVVVAAVFSVLLMITRVREVLYAIPYVGLAVKYYMQTITSSSFFALMERATMLIIVLVLWYTSPKDVQLEHRDFVKAYLLGFTLYLFFVQFPLVASRVGIVFKIFEVVLIPNLLRRRTKYKQLIIVAIFMISIVMYGKNIYSYMYQGKYNDKVNILNYPYVSIFEKDKLWRYRSSDIYRDLLNLD